MKHRHSVFLDRCRIQVTTQPQADDGLYRAVGPYRIR
jgi:hypothetical protein